MVSSKNFYRHKDYIFETFLNNFIMTIDTSTRVIFVFRFEGATAIFGRTSFYCSLLCHFRVAHLHVILFAPSNNGFRGILWWRFHLWYHNCIWTYLYSTRNISGGPKKVTWLYTVITPKVLYIYSWNFTSLKAHLFFVSLLNFKR